MANEQHLEWLLEGVGSWNAKRRTQEFHSLAESDLVGADLQKAHLASADLGAADLRDAILVEANLNHAHLIGTILVRADLRKANLESAVLVGANLREANLSEANLNHADLGEAVLEAAWLERARLERAVLVAAVLQGTVLHQALLREANLGAAVLKEADLNGADLIRADLTNAVLEEADLSGALLADADLTGTNLRGAELEGADLTGATLTGAILTGANLHGANLTGAFLEKAVIAPKELAKARRLPTSVIAFFLPNELGLLKASQFAGDSFQTLVRLAKEQNADSVTAQISFEPEHCEAGKAVLGYFAQILEQKYPEEPVRVTISQERTEVKMTIIGTDELPVEQISVDLGNYLQVVTGDTPVEELLRSRIEIEELRFQLRAAALLIENKERLREIERRHNHELLESERRHSDEKQALLQGRVDQAEERLTAAESKDASSMKFLDTFTQAQLTVSGRAVEGLAETSKTLAASTDRSIHHLGELATKLREDARDASEADRNALALIAALVEKIDQNPDHELTDTERQEAEQIIPSASPNAWRQISQRLEEASQGIMTNTAFDFLKTLLANLLG